MKQGQLKQDDLEQQEPRPVPFTDDIATYEADVAEPTGEVVRRGGTFESLRHRDFSWFLAGALVSNTGTWMQTTALAIVVWALRHREFDLGLVNFISGIPVLFLALPGGLLADRVDKRKLLIWSQGVLGVLATVLWVLYRLGRLGEQHAIEALVWISAIGLLGGVMSALTFPAWQAFLPDLVPRRTLMNAIALNSAQFQSSRLLGPLAASALLVAGLTSGDIFLANAASYLFVIASLFAIRPHAESADRPVHAKRAGDGPWRTLTAGVSYAVEHPVVGLLLLSTAFMTIFAMPYMMLLPAIAEKTLHGPDGGKLYYAWLMATNGFGALLGSLLVAGLPSDTDRERLIPPSILVMSGLLIAFSLSRVFWLSLVLSTACGVAFLTVNSLTNTSIQATVPHALRGRVMSLFVMSFMGIMPVSAIVFGPLGEWAGPANAVLGGAVILAAWGVWLQVSQKLRPKDAAATQAVS